MSPDVEKHRRWVREAEFARSAAIYYLGKGIIEEFGEEKGKALIVKQVREWGHNNGEARRKVDESQGLVNNLKTFSRLAGTDDIVYSFAWVGTTVKASDDERIVEWSYCPIAEGFKRLGKEAIEIGELFCNNIDNAIIQGYNPDYECMRESSLNLNGLCRLHFIKK